MPFRFRASSTHGYAPQISPNMNVNFPCASSSSTARFCRERFRCLRATHLRFLAASMTFLFVASQFRRECDRRRQVVSVVTQTHSQASSPRSVTLPQLPSPRTLSPRMTVGMLPSREPPVFVQGTCTPQVHAHVGRTMNRSSESRRICMDNRSSPPGYAVRSGPPCLLISIVSSDIPSNGLLITDGLVRDSRPLFDARFACRELHPFLENRARLDDGR